MQVCTSTVNEHILELFVDFKKALIRSGGRSCNILDEFGLPVKVVGLFKYVYMNRLVNIRLANVCLTHFVLRMVCNKANVSWVMKALHVARTERDMLEVRGLDGRKTLNWILKE